MVKVIDNLTSNVISSHHLVISNFDYVREGDTILEDKIEGISIKSPNNGYFVQNNYYFPMYQANDQLGFVADTLEEAFSTLYYTEPYIEQDPFTNTRKIAWREKPKLLFNPLSFYNCGVIPLSDQLFFTFEFIENNAVIVFHIDNKIKLSKSDCISILFDNGKILDFNVKEKPVKGYFDTISCNLYQEDIDIFLQSKMITYRFTYHKEGCPSMTGECGKFYGEYSFEGIVSYVHYFLDIIKNLLPHYHLPMRSLKTKHMKFDYNWCYVYLMKDLANGYHKIGISNTPEYREKTLQSEKPSIVLLACKKFPTRKIAEAFESALHTAYNQQRLRGEWFDLNEEDVAAIIETLK